MARGEESCSFQGLQCHRHEDHAPLRSQARRRITEETPPPSSHALSEAEEDILYLHSSIPCLKDALLEMMFWIEFLKDIVRGKRLLENTFNDWLETAPHLLISYADRYARLLEFCRMLISQPKWRYGGILLFSRGTQMVIAGRDLLDDLAVF